MESNWWWNLGQGYCIWTKQASRQGICSGTSADGKWRRRRFRWNEVNDPIRLFTNISSAIYVCMQRYIMITMHYVYKSNYIQILHNIWLLSRLQDGMCLLTARQKPHLITVIINHSWKNRARSAMLFFFHIKIYNMCMTIDACWVECVYAVAMAG